MQEENRHLQSLFAEKDEQIEKLEESLKVKAAFQSYCLKKVWNGYETMNGRCEVLQKENEITRRLVKIHQDFQFPFDISKADLKVTDINNLTSDHVEFIFECLESAFRDLDSL